MINIQNFQQTDYTSAGTSTLSSDIKELKEKVRAIEAKIATDTDAFTQSPGIESIPDKKAVANACQEIPQQNVKGKGLFPGIKIAAASVTGFAAGFVIGKITEEAEKAIEESDKNNESSTRDNKENVTTGNEVKTHSCAEKNTEEHSSGRVKGFNVKSGELPDADGIANLHSKVSKTVTENRILRYAAYDETGDDRHRGLPGDVHLILSQYHEWDGWEPTVVSTKYIDIKFDPESNILESFNMTEELSNLNNGDKKIISTRSAKDKGNYILYKSFDSEYGHQATKYDKRTHKTTNAGFLDQLL